MANAKAGITLGLEGAEQTASGMEQVAQRGTSAFQRLRGSMDDLGTRADYAEGKLKKLNRGIGDATGAVQLVSTVIPGLGGSFGALAGVVGNVADVFGTLSSVLLKNPLGLAAIAATGAFVAYKAFNTETDTSAANTKRFVEAIEAAEKAVVKLADATDPNVAILNRLNLELEAQRVKLGPIAAEYGRLRDAIAQQNAPAELSADNQRKLAEAYARSAKEGDALKARMEQLSKSNLDAKLFEITAAAKATTDAFDKANLEFTRGVSAMAALQASIDRVNFSKVRDELNKFSAGPVGNARDEFEQRKKQIDAFFGDGGNDAEFARLSKANRDKLAKDLEDAKPKPTGGGKKTEADKLPEQYARLAASLDPVIARERELIEANRILEDAQANLGISTETITDLKQRLADKAYAATDAGKADAAAVAEAQRLYDASITPMEAYEKQLLAIAKALELNKISEEQANRARDGAKKQLEQANDESAASKKTARELGLAFSSAFEDAVVGGKKLRDVIDGLGKDLLRVFIRRQLTEPLLELFNTAAKGIGGSGGLFDGLLGGVGKGLGGLIGGLFNGDAAAQTGAFYGSGPTDFLFAKGGAFSGGAEVVPFASGGGIVRRPSLFPMRGGKVGLMGEAGPEAILPLDRDASGKLGVRSGGGGGGMVVQITNSIDARGADKSLRDALPGLLRQTERNVLSQFERLVDRGGSLSRKTGRRSA